MSLLIKRGFLSKSECLELSNWVNTAMEKDLLLPVPDGINPRDYSLENEHRVSTRKSFPNLIQAYPDIVYDVQRKIEIQANLQGLKHSSQGGLDGIVASYAKPLGDLYEHIDPMEDYRERKPNIHCLRLNVVTQMPDSGGVLYVERRPVQLEVGDLHGYVVSMRLHSVTEVKGDKARICWMFGYQLPKDEPRFARWS